MLIHKSFKKLVPFVLGLTLFAGCNNVDFTKEQLNEIDDIYDVMQFIDLSAGDVLMRNTDENKDMATWTTSKPLETYFDEGSLSVESGFYVPNKLPENFSLFNEYTISALYLTKDSIDLSKPPIKSYFNDTYSIYKAENPYDAKIENFVYYARPSKEELEHQSLSFSYEVFDLDKNYDLDYLIANGIVIAQDENLEDYDILEISSDLFEKAYYVETFDKEEAKNKFIRVYGINPIDEIEYYNFDGNTETVTKDNIDNYKKYFNYGIFVLGYTEFKTIDKNTKAYVEEILPVSTEEMLEVFESMTFYNN